MHQPWYLDPEKEEFLLPWVRFHGTKDYLDMAKLLKEFPAVRGVINVTPCLVEQILLYGQGVRDRHQILSQKSAEILTSAEISEFLETGFVGNPERMIHPYPRYYSLMAKAQRKQSFSTQELRDLQVWSNLVWMDPRWRREIPPVAQLMTKGSLYTEQEKQELLQIQSELLAKIIPAYRDLQDTGQVELSTSPWAHPILPLLADTEVARQTNPGMPLPTERFQFPEDVVWHLEKAAVQYADWFGRPPKGLWPSEGALSQTVLPEIKKAGFHWVATDEELLWKSLRSSSQGPFPREALYRPYRLPLNGENLVVLFRDHVLSDLIGFVYSSWSASRAAADFVERLRAIEKSIPAEVPGLALIALDGENAWESYPEDGEPFLRALYQVLSDEKSIRCTTISEFLEKAPVQAELPAMSPGSWIRGELSTWIGHGPQNRAWEELAKARRIVSPKETTAISIAQGSDWFWWLGPEHSSPQDPVFDRIFRCYLKSAYRSAGKVSPASLEESFKPVLPLATAPMGFITPTLDGKVTSYFEWLQAGEVDLSYTGSAMARARPFFSKLWWGDDESNLYFRLDPTDPLEELSVRLILQGDHFQVNLELNRGIVKGIPESVRVAAGKILEIAIPRSGVLKEETIKVMILVEQEGLTLERYPEQGQLSLNLSHPKASSELWSA